MWYADQDKRPMWLALFGTAIGLAILSVLVWFWHAPTEHQPVDSWRVEGNAGAVTGPAQRSDPAIGE